MKKKVMIIGALPSSLINFRGVLVKAILDKGYHVVCMAGFKDNDVVQRLNSMGVPFYNYTVERHSLNPFADLMTVRDLRSTFQKLQPDIILAYTIKPVIWGAIASCVLPTTRFYALITGLGFAFQGESFKRKFLIRMVTFLYRIALFRAEKVIFQNSDNFGEFVQRGIVSADKCEVVNGSGIDLKNFSEAPLVIEKPVFLTIGRLLGEKGFREYAAAAEIVKAKYPEVVFQLLGPEDISPDGIPLDEVRAWHENGVIEYLGSTNDVRPYIKQSNIFVLPSYHEGMPRTVLEAMAIGRPILTTNVPGCRETVISGENGWLVEKANVNQLVERMVWFIENQDGWERMAKRSRELAEEKFDVDKVNAQLMEIMGL